MRGLQRSCNTCALVALACAHQRLGWVRPFVADLNGRGNLSEKALIVWVDDALDTCLAFEATVLKRSVRTEALR